MSSTIGNMGAAAEAVISNGMHCVRGGNLSYAQNVTVNGTGLCMLYIGHGNSVNWSAQLTIDGVSNIAAENFMVATAAYGYIDNHYNSVEYIRASCVIPFQNSITIHNIGNTSLNYAVYTV